MLYRSRKIFEPVYNSEVCSDCKISLSESVVDNSLIYSFCNIRELSLSTGSFLPDDLPVDAAGSLSNAFFCVPSSGSFKQSANK